jgi:thioredoxin 1
MIHKFWIFLAILSIIGGCTSSSERPLEGGGYISSTGIVYDYTPEKFSTAMNNSRPTLLGFFADWCIYCKKMNPTIEEVKTLYKGRANILTANIDEERDLAKEYSIRVTPTLVFFDKNGRLVLTLVGYQNKEKIIQELEKLIQ